MLPQPQFAHKRIPLPPIIDPFPPDGTYQVSTPAFTAGFVIRDRKLVACAPILRKRLLQYLPIAKRIP